jgi:endonuclease/exonuclease/phosphatase family metal-dependent hydrolase
MTFSLLTYNIHKGFNVTGKFTLHKMKSAIQNVAPDIVCLQELQGEHIKKQEKISTWPKQPQIEFLADDTWSYYAYGKNVERQLSDHGNGIISKLPIIKHCNIDITSSIFSSRGLLHTVIEIEKQLVHVMCTHLGLLKTERKLQYDELKKRIEQTVNADEPLILAGDFNDWRIDADEFLQTNLNLTEVFTEAQGKPASSFPSMKPLLRVDRVYYRGLTVVKCQKLSSAPWPQLSDHIPLLVSFNL